MKYLLALQVLLVSFPLLSQSDADQDYRQFFEHYQDKRGVTEKILNAVGMTGQDVGRSFAFIAGVNEYKNLPESNQLPPAEIDMDKLVYYLREVEKFDEIVVLRNEGVNLLNISYFLQTYFPNRLSKFPKSRFLFAYSGHGFYEAPRGYLLASGAKSLEDKNQAVNMKILRTFFDEVVDKGYYTLALINACHSGSFLSRPFGSAVFPKAPGAHAITSGGADQLSWHDPNVGAGSVFFEKFFDGVSGPANLLSAGSGDVIITSMELGTYLESTVRFASNDKQNPKFGDISKNGSDGSFFFLHRVYLEQKGYLDSWRPSTNSKISFGVSPNVSIARLPKDHIQHVSYVLPSPLDESDIPKHKEKKTFKVTDDLSFTMVYLKAGSFIMGSPESEPGHENNERQNLVTLDNGFWLGETEVTQAQWQAVMGKNPSKIKGKSNPVETISWSEIQEFLKKLNQTEGRGVYRYRLPTEPEWEYACRAGSKAAYSFGSDPNSLKQYAQYDSKGSKPVKSLEPNSWGLYDMHGNVWEWCQAQPGPGVGKKSMFRGGSWDDKAGYCRSAKRHIDDRDKNGFYNLGMRLVLSSELPLDNVKILLHHSPKVPGDDKLFSIENTLRSLGADVYRHPGRGFTAPDNSWAFRCFDLKDSVSDELEKIVTKTLVANGYPDQIKWEQPPEGAYVDQINNGFDLVINWDD